ncbi:MAG: hypothetical protein ACRED0_00815 [Gammaproteobacteria bacterium]
MKRNEDRWRHCYWKEWAMIKKRWDCTRRGLNGPEDGTSQNKVRLSRLAVRRPRA